MEKVVINAQKRGCGKKEVTQLETPEWFRVSIT